MEFLETSLSGVIHIRPRIFTDHRGEFLELYQRRLFVEAGITLPFVQDNFSRSARNVLRGLHYQVQHPQGKLVTCLEGDVFDVAVDLRRASASFGRWLGIRLSQQNRESLYIPPGFAHGFYVLSEQATVLYKCTDFYHPESERTLAWNAPEVKVEWPLTGEPVLSEKDRGGKPLSAAECFET